MPLMANLQPLGFGEHDPSTVQLDSQHATICRGRQQEKDSSSGYEDFDFDSYNHDDSSANSSDMEGSILHRPRPKKAVKQPPAVPQRSDKRASKILENVLLELKSLNGAAPSKDAERQSEVSDPHELYLSSEEDASLSGDYDDSLLDFEPSEAGGDKSKPSSRASSRRSQEDTARVVSFTSVGKPQIVDIFVPSTAQKRHSVALDTLTANFSNSSKASPKNTRRPTPLKLYPSSIRRLSISSIPASITTNISPLTIHQSNQSLTSLPPRKSSKLSSNLSSIMTSAKNSFLASDPFPETHHSQNTEDGEPVAPKTPTSMAAAAWKKSLSHTMSKARKHNMPKLSLAYTPGVINPRSSRSNLVSQFNESESSSESISQRPSTSAESSYSHTRNAKGEEEGEKNLAPQRSFTLPNTPSQESPPKTPNGGPVRYEDIMRSVIRAPPTTPDDVKEREKGGRKMSLGSKMMGVRRKKSVKER